MPRGDNPNSRANLKPARCGEVRNPSGINRKRPISVRYAELSEEPLSLNLIQRFNRRWKAKLLFPGDSYARAKEQMRRFAREVLPLLPPPAAGATPQSGVTSAVSTEAAQ